MKNTLRRFLFNKRIELYEEVDRIKTKLLGDISTERDTIDLDVAQEKLNLIKEIITICTNRGKF